MAHRITTRSIVMWSILFTAAMWALLSPLVYHYARAGTIQVATTGLNLKIATKTGTYTFLPSDYAIVGDTTGGGFTVNLEAAPVTGQIHVIKKSVAANTLTLGGNGNNIDGAASVALTTQYTSYTVQFDGTAWWIE